MTGEGWDWADDPTGMLDALRGRVAERTLRLFCAACCRRSWNPFIDPAAVLAVRAAEAFADGALAADDLARAHSAASSAAHRPAAAGYLAHAARAAALTVAPRLADPLADEAAAVACALAVADLPAATTSPPTPRTDGYDEYVAERAVQAELLRCIAGDPFTSAVLDPAVRTATVLELARAISDRRRYDRLPILADAVEEAGSGDPSLLAHLRCGGPHARGCHALDLILGRGRP